MQEKQNLSKIVNFIFQTLAPFKLLIIGQFVISMMWAIDLSLRPYLLKKIIDLLPIIDPQSSYSALVIPALCYIAMSALITIISRLYDFLSLKLYPPLKQHTGLILLERMSNHSYSFYQNHFAGSLTNKINDVMNGIPELITKFIDPFFSNALALIFAISALWSVNIHFAAALFLWVICFILFAIKFSTSIRIISTDIAEKRSSLIGIIVDILSNMISVRLFTGKKTEQKTLKNIFNIFTQAEQRRVYFFIKIFTLQGLSFIFYQSLCLFWLISGYKNGQVSAGDFVLVLTINISTIDHLWSLARDIGKYVELIGNISQGLNLILSPVEIEDKPTAKPLKITAGKIIFKKVKFHYKGSSPLFENLSVTIKAGQKIGMVGYSGSGKTSFVNLILRQFEISQGSILIDEQDIRKVTQESLYRAIGVIPQEPALFHRTLMDNIRYGRINSTDDEVIEAAKKAYAHEFIIQLPEGYNSLVGERGVKLSGGQRQRIAIARAILKNAPILILDEATSQLDSLTENQIQDSLWKLMQGKTTLVIAHRLSTLLNMDRLLIFDQGKIIEDGTHKQLIAQGGLYKTLWEAQVGGFLPEHNEDQQPLLSPTTEIVYPPNL
ncbi:ABC transporter ATP-binding protein [Rickettsiales endosymbiont of Stachyamoeba lipophora]|uniref:ABC transporter ATP-binding protein n=1 Tax=Rickettsiales endosymbiont of Stachyamoeba lipophora TaxID=2486578 RepID=UPI000F652E37|nr:ABC transporter ATP-binding protein [Rickettsiales endosymbiont of Stachyamoeba lipophora]AZL16120.1 ABC transporter ATP-binding protein [Rickettsiales endosymbiont of Stachyamoeba lipophora]